MTHGNVPFSSNGNYERRSSKLADKMPNARVVFERTHSYLRLLPACSKIARTNVKVGKTRLLDTQHVACVWPPCCDVLSVVGSSLTMVKFEPTTPNMSQHIATGWLNARNILRPTMLRYVALACCDRLAGALLTACKCCLSIFTKIKLLVKNRDSSMVFSVFALLLKCNFCLCNIF